MIETETLDVPSNHESVRRFQARVTEGPDVGKLSVSRGERMVVGTHESADLVLTDGAVSRFQIELGIDGNQLVARDLGSRNGTKVNGVTVRDAVLPTPCTMLVGRSRIEVSIEDTVIGLETSKEQRFGRLVGQSLPMRQAFALLERAAATTSTVLLVGETGTGKEEAAAAVHELSARREKPFVVVDCAALPAALLETELFGHERGAFTGAVAAREGAFELAEGGTLFLDEIGELPTELQPKLLRALESREIKRVGTSKYQTIDVRIVAATHRDLRTEVNAKRFRPDLYYRLAVLEIRLPPLRERAADIPLLVSALIAGLGASDEARDRLLAEPLFFDDLAGHAWPGNVRELRNYLERAIAFGVRPPLEDALPTLPQSIDVSIPLSAARERWVATFERAYLERIIADHDGNVTAAARSAKIDRAFFYRLLWRHGLR